MGLYETHGLYQRDIYIKAAVYLTLNSLVIPTLSLAQGSDFTSLYDFFANKEFTSLTQLASELYVANAGVFFVSLVI